MNAPSGRVSDPISKAIFLGVLSAIVLAGCAGAPRKPRSRQDVAEPAGQRDPMAQLRLGVRILAQARTPGERAAGVAWIRRAAGENLAMAQGRLGWMYLTGDAVPQDTSRALKWLRRAANRGAPAAQLQLGRLYATGAVLPRDETEAYYWYSIAAKPVRSDVTILDIAQVRYAARMRAHELAASLTPGERIFADRLVAAWAPTPSVPYRAVLPLGGPAR